jgi:hypothetical protein
MANFTVAATISSPPTRVGVTINKSVVLSMQRDGDENWAGKKSGVILPNSFETVVAAVGVTKVPFTAEIRVTDDDGAQVADVKRNLALSASGILIAHIPIQLVKA